MERRELLRWMVATGGLAAFNRLSAQDLGELGVATHRAAHRNATGTLSHADAATITAAAERIIPRTETPGATDAGVTAFIDTMLRDWYTPAERDTFLAGIALLDTRASAIGTRIFVACTPAEQDAILTAFDDEVTALRRTNAATANEHWFAMLKYLTVWGYCTSEPGMTQTLHTWPLPMRYDGNAPVAR